MRVVPASIFGSALVVVALVVAACWSGTADDDPGTTTATIAPTATSVPGPGGCDDVTALFSVEAVLDGPAGRCLDWVDRSYGRAVRGSTGSATIWSRRSEYGTALIVGALHTLGLGWFGPADIAVSESIVNPDELTGVPRLFLIRPGRLRPRYAGESLVRPLPPSGRSGAQQQPPSRPVAP